MEESTVRKMLTEKIWQIMEPVVLAAKHSRAGAPGELSDRDFIEAILYHNRVGGPWRDLPPVLGYWHAIYMRFRRWETRGVWARLWTNLQSERFAEARALFIDSTTIRAHPHAAGAPKKTVRSRLWAALVAAGAPKSMPPRSMKTAALRST